MNMAYSMWLLKNKLYTHETVYQKYGLQPL